MEKTWEDFWSSGKISDYLSYRNGVVDGAGMQMEQKEQEKDGTGSGAYRDGIKCHADWRL